ncbi:MAG: hypothetical protein ABIJ97_09655, partial [Bacteroidota bacterium]
LSFGCSYKTVNFNLYIIHVFIFLFFKLLSHGPDSHDSYRDDDKFLSWAFHTNSILIKNLKNITFFCNLNTDKYQEIKPIHNSLGLLLINGYFLYK